jgi:hypothetical protein
MLWLLFHAIHERKSALSLNVSAWVYRLKENDLLLLLLFFALPGIFIWKVLLFTFMD